jgi:haloacetate dehalogenase
MINRDSFERGDPVCPAVAYGNASSIACTSLSKRAFLAGAGSLAVLGATRANTPAAPLDHLDAKYFPGFSRQTVQTSGTTINLLVGGRGFPLLLLHGYPENHMAWRKVAPALARNFTVVISDLRGYGDSGKPAGGDGHVNYSKRRMALDQAEMMERLGHPKFSVVGHDRGARVAQRLGLDFLERVEKLILIDVVPTDYAYRTVDKEFATAYWHWFFLIQDAPFPETVLGGHIDEFLRKTFAKGFDRFIEPDIYADYLRCFNDPATLHAACEDYRAGASIDLDDAATDISVKIRSPTIVAWGSQGLIGRHYDLVAVWKDYADHVQGLPLACGHWAPEEVPDELVQHISSFCADAGRR